MSGNQVQDDAGGGGGSGGRGVESRVRVTNPGLLRKKPSTTPTPPNFCEGRADRPPSHPRGGGRPSQELGRVGLMDGSTPQAPAPTRTTPALSAKLALEKRSLAESYGVVRVGTGALMGVPKLRLRVVGWALVPRTCPRPRLSTPRNPSRARSGWNLGWRGGGGSGEDRGIVGHPSIPPSLGTTPKKIVPGEGG